MVSYDIRKVISKEQVDDRVATSEPHYEYRHEESKNLPDWSPSLSREELMVRLIGDCYSRLIEDGITAHDSLMHNGRPKLYDVTFNFKIADGDLGVHAFHLGEMLDPAGLLYLRVSDEEEQAELLDIYLQTYRRYLNGKLNFEKDE